MGQPEERIPRTPPTRPALRIERGVNGESVFGTCLKRSSPPHWASLAAAISSPMLHGERVNPAFIAGGMRSGR